MSALPPHVSFPDAPAQVPCPACAGQDARQVYAVGGIPANSCVLLGDEASARAYPTGDLVLAHCPACGFLFNTAFDEARIDYSEDYEETQACSPTFTAWLEALVERLVARAGLDGGTVVEVGCGRGDFLELLCRRADCCGIGVDPSGTAGRVDAGAGQGLEFLREHYGPKHAHLPADLLACRHTLEHLAPVAEVARLFRENLRPQARVFVEVPDVRRVLEEGAFWDVYYEHCSYFSAGSLARLLRAAGFELETLELEYGGHVLQVLGRGAAGPTAAALALEEDLDAMESAVATFRAACRASLERWHAVLEQARAAGEGLVLWGSTSKAAGFITTLGAGDAVRAVVDINPAKHGRCVAGSGHCIVGPQELVEIGPERVVVLNPLYRAEIEEELGRLGVRAEVAVL